MSGKKKLGRPPKTFRSKSGDYINGLYRRPRSDRWRILETGYEFTEHDEALAIARFRQWQRSRGYETVTITVAETEFADRASFREAWGGDVQLIPAYGEQPAQLSLELHECVFWPWLKRQLHERPVEIADKVGIPFSVCAFVLVRTRPTQFRPANSS